MFIFTGGICNVYLYWWYLQCISLLMVFVMFIFTGGICNVYLY